jgi:hypothetical protein
LKNDRLINSDSKNQRGFNNLDTADHLCPLILRDQFNDDPMYATVTFSFCANYFSSSVFMDQVEDGKIEITSEDLPSFLYETGTVYDPQNEAAGLFRGFLLVRVSTFFNYISLRIQFFPQVYRHIFTGPASAMNPNHTGATKNKACLFQITAVTGRTIAYACVQASHICIS